ncbi:MAG TPA: TatD family deoxyribonuclease [Gammaproteobacteria bacterium]|nr:TatD family deoxyribonuclease [Gammaproteobacteria bacterium]
MELFDTHCHLDVTAFDTDRGEVLANARARGVRQMLVPAIDAAGWDGLQTLCAGEKGLYPALGLHPMFLAHHQPGHVAALERRVGESRPLAIGEIGLDFQQRDADRDAQIRLFEAQLVIARDAGLPVVLHVRKAHDAVLNCLQRIPVAGGTVHAFSGSEQQAQRYLDLGFKLGFGGVLTWPEARRVHQLATRLPATALVLETDAPDMAVQAHRGGRNSPEYLPEILSALARLREQAPGVLARQTTDNAREAFGLA